jgi:hypothetical protein
VPRRFTLSQNTNTNKWELKNEQTDRLIKVFPTKEAATRKGVLEIAIGKQGGSVLIRKKDGVFEEERRFGAG